MGMRYVICCDQPGCERADEAQFDAQRGIIVHPGWRWYNGRSFCGPLHVAQYAASEAAAETEALAEALKNGATDGQANAAALA